MNRHNYILVVLLIVNLQFLISNIQAQTYFNNEFKNDLSIYSLGSSIYALAGTNGYMVVGDIPNSPNIYLRVVRLNIYGDTVWTKIYDNYLHLKYTGMGKMISIGDTNFVFTGVIYTDSITQTGDSSLISLFKIDLNGNLLWRHYFGDNDKKNDVTDIQQTSDGGFIITGWTTGWGNTIANSSFLLKVDALGNEVWHRIYGGGSQRGSYAVDLTNDNGYIFSGIFYQGLATRYDINVIKTDSLGNVIWNKTYGTVEDDNAGYISKYGVTGDYILTAAIDIAPGNILDDFQAYIARINGVDGSIVWVDTFGIVNNGTNDVLSSNPIILDNGDIVGIGGTHFSSSGGGVNAWLVKYDGNGNRLWQRTFNKYGGNNQHYFWDIQSTFDKGFIICGDLTNISIPEKNLWVLKLDSMGCEVVNCSVGVEEEAVLKEIVKVYPNPTKDIITIQINETTFNNGTFKLIDVMGKEVLNRKIESNTTSIDISQYTKGVYFYQLINYKERISGKLIIQ